MFSGEYDLERTCRCCLRDLSKLIPLNKPYRVCDDSEMKSTANQRTIGEVLMEFANIQFSAEDGLPQKVCRKCIAAVRAAFNFRKLCEQNDAKLREFFGQHLVTVKEDKFDIYFVDDSCDSTEEAKFDANLTADYSYINERMDEEQKVINQNDGAHHTNDVKINLRCDTDPQPSDRLHIVPEMNVNGVPNVYKCHICSSAFPRNFKIYADYQKHMTKHKREKRFSCDICQAQFTMKRNLTGHMDTHLPDKYRHLCSYCGKAFHKLLAFKAHIMYEHTGERPFKCDVCNNSFHKLANLKRHKMTHLDVKPHACTFCHKTFVKSDKLARHLRVHTGERPFVCHCGKTFNQTTNFKAHQRIHTGETPYKCICGELFSQSQQLLKHRRKYDHFEVTAAPLETNPVDQPEVPTDTHPEFQLETKPAPQSEIQIQIQSEGQPNIQ